MLVCWRKNVEDFKFKSLLLRKSRLCVSSEKGRRRKRSFSNQKVVLSSARNNDVCSQVWIMVLEKRKENFRRKEGKKPAITQKRAIFSCPLFSFLVERRLPHFCPPRCVTYVFSSPKPAKGGIPRPHAQTALPYFPHFYLNPSCVLLQRYPPIHPPNDPHLSLSDMEESCHEYPPHML